jgi:hypothetical protein
VVFLIWRGATVRSLHDRAASGGSPVWRTCHIPATRWPIGLATKEKPLIGLPIGGSNYFFSFKAEGWYRRHAPSMGHTFIG